ncbi:hypothetical protein V6N13_031883 [Hibiscus sabdariffa]|uniref:Uncharacterized protein n=2 Tax=Hibiscus sabdariffa TaxID=183260 RepID=A0ABR2APY5_9ROSI
MLKRVEAYPMRVVQEAGGERRGLREEGGRIVWPIDLKGGARLVDLGPLQKLGSLCQLPKAKLPIDLSSHI